MEEISNMSAILLLYLFIFFKYLFYAIKFFDMQFITATLMIVLLSWINMSADKIPDEIKDSGKFMGHIMFISVCFSMFSEIINAIYCIIFRYGFVNTIIILHVFFLVSMSGLINIFKEKIKFYLSKSHLGNMILNGLNYYYNTYIVTKKYNERIMEIIKYYFNNYVWYYTKIIFSKFVKINVELSDNQQFKIVKNKMNNKYESIKQFAVEKMIQPYVMSSIQSALEKDPFSLGTLLNDPVKNGQDGTRRDFDSGSSIP